MSHSSRTIDDLLALELPCTTCHAGRGTWCEIREGYKTAGRPAQFLHAGRGWSTRHARWVGQTTGQVDAIAGIIWELEHPRDPTVLTPGGREWIRDILERRLEQAERWAQSAHQRALADIPASWQR